MKTAAAKTLKRLLNALEELGRREDGALAGGDGQSFLELEMRAVPLVQRIVTLVTTGANLPADLIAMGRDIVETRKERRQRLMHLLETTRDEISRIDGARRQIRAFRPSYNQRGHTRQTSGFAAVG